MIKIIFNQIWNQRKMNGWIFIELLAVSFFLWVVLDPVCVLTATKNIAPGYEKEGRMVVRLTKYEETNPRYDAEAEKNDSMKVAHYKRVARIIRDLPEVGSLTIPMQMSFPGSGNWSGMTLYRDTADVAKNESVHLQWYAFVEGSNPFATYGMKSVHTGRYLNPEEKIKGVYISENLALELFGTNDVVGKKVYQNAHKDTELTIAGVFEDYKHYEYQQPYPLLIYFQKEIEASPYMHWRYPFVFKLKEGVNEETFKKRFISEVVPQLSWGNLRFYSINSFSDAIKDMNEMDGINNKIRLNYALAGFAVLCIFLGMLGTFWIRSNARRQEIGVMRSMGASRQRIVLQFLTEATLLVTMAFVCALPLLLHYAYVEGMYETGFTGSNPIISSMYWVNNFWEHFCMVSLITYLILLLIALVGTIIPVKRAANVLPADALRDE